MNETKSLIKSKNRDNNYYFYPDYYYKFSKTILNKKYLSFKYSYSSICIHNLIFNEKCRIVSIFKDYLILDDDTEFLRISFEKAELKNSLKKVIDFYEKYNKVFPNYMILPENVFMYKNLRKKQKMLDEYNKMKEEKEKKEKYLKNNLKNQNIIKKNIFLFDEKIKENINRQSNSMLTLSLTNTIISNCINFNENKKNENNIGENNSFVESNIYNASFSISLYSKRSQLNKNENCINNNILPLYEDTLRSESSLKNIIDVLNNRKYKKVDFRNKIKIKKPNNLNFDRISNNNANNNKILINNVKIHNYIIKTPTKKQCIKKEKDIKQIYQVNQKSLNNNKTIFNHRKNRSDFHSVCQTIKSTKGKILSKKKSIKYFSKFRKNKNNIIEEITSSLIGKNKSKQRNRKKFIEGKNLFNNTNNTKKIENLTISHDKYERFNSKICDNNKEKKVIKVNNYVFKRIRKYQNNILKYNKNMKKNLEEEKNNNNEEINKNNKIYEIFNEKYKSNFNYQKKEQIKEINKPIIETNSMESTKISFNYRKTKFNTYLTYDKINNSNNPININNNLFNSNNEALQTHPKPESICNFNTLTNFNSNNYKNIVTNTDNNYNNNCKNNNNSSGINLGKNTQKKNKICVENKKMMHKKHKTFSSQLLSNNFFFTNNCSQKEDDKMIYLNVKLKKIKEKILKNKNNYKEIKEKYRKLSEINHKKKIIYPKNSCIQKIFEKEMTCSIFNNNSIEKRQIICNNSTNINKHNETRNKIKNLKKDKNIITVHQRNHSLITNNYRSPFGKKIKKDITKDNIKKNRDVIVNKANYKKNKYAKKN